MDQPTRETVIIVHGTWAAPKPGLTNWYEPANGDSPAGSFVTKLDKALIERGSPARCWAHCNGSDEIFHWSGANHWVERTIAAAALRKYLAKIDAATWRYHILAHSHGGNVLLEAIYSGEPSGLQKIVTLGTPYINTSEAINTSLSRKNKFIRVITAILLVFITAIPILFAISDYYNSSDTWISLVSLAISALIFFCLTFVFKKTRAIRTASLAQLSPRRETSNFLAISSSFDEAWQLLHHLRHSDNPFSVKQPFFPFLWDLLKHDIRDRFQIAKANGAKSFNDVTLLARVLLVALYSLVILALVHYYRYLWPDTLSLIRKGEFLPAGSGAYAELVQADQLARALGFVLVCLLTVTGALSLVTGLLGEDFYSAFWSPFRWCRHMIFSLTSIFHGVGTRYVRKRGWQIVQSAALGLDGYAYRLPQVDRVPTLDHERPVRYEDLPETIENRALSARTAWLIRNFGDVSRTFTKLVVTAADINSLMHAVETDQSLVHGAYYTDDECIARIADWIATKDDLPSER